MAKVVQLTDESQVRSTEDGEPRPHPHPNGERCGLSAIDRVARWAVEIYDVSKSAMFTWLIIRSLERENGDGCYAKVSTLAEMRELKERTIKYHLADLREAGFLTRVRRGRTSAERWATTPDDFEEKVSEKREQMGWTPLPT